MRRKIGLTGAESYKDKSVTNWSIKEVAGFFLFVSGVIFVVVVVVFFSLSFFFLVIFVRSTQRCFCDRFFGVVSCSHCEITVV